MQLLHMMQRPLSAQQALDFAPTGAWQRLARRVALGLSRVAALEAPPGINPCQRGSKLRPRLVGMHRLRAEPLCRAPGPPGSTRDPTRLTPLPPVSFPLGLGLTRRVALPLRVLPLPL